MPTTTFNRTTGFVAAITVVIAVVVAVGWTFDADATTPSSAVAYVPSTPCRLFDTRPNHQTGGRSAPLGPTEVQSVVGRGAAGACTGGASVPSTATALQLNVTAVGATEPTHLTIFPTGEPRPNASSLNPAPGQPPVPNAVTATLGTNGRFDVYNHAGRVHLIIDVVGYYTAHHHDDRYYTKTQINALVGSDTAFERTEIVTSGGTPAGNGAALAAAVDAIRRAGADVDDPWHLHLEPGDYELDAPLTLPRGTSMTGPGARIEAGSNMLTFTDNRVDDLVIATDVGVFVEDQLDAVGVRIDADAPTSAPTVTVSEGAVARLESSELSRYTSADLATSVIESLNDAVVIVDDTRIYASGEDVTAVRGFAQVVEVTDSSISVIGPDGRGIDLAGATTFATIDGTSVSAPRSLRVGPGSLVEVTVEHSTFDGLVDSEVGAAELTIVHSTVDGGLFGDATCMAVTSTISGSPAFLATSCPFVI